MTALRQSQARSARIETIVQGQYKVSRDANVVFSTILGSCVSVTLFDPEARIGGMNHYLLPEAGGAGQRDVKYGALAIELLVNDLLKAGAVRARLTAGLFGGANIMSGLGDIGSRNARFARDFMRREGFPVVDDDLGGRQARRLQFFPAEGRSRVVLVPQSDGVSVARAERRVVPPPQQDVTLF